jgi:quercetin dioxygenase-like cupin family protein
MSSIRVERWDSEDGPLTEKRYIGFLEREGYEVAVFAYRAGTVFPEHENAFEKCDAVLEGVLRITAGGVAYDLEPGDRLYLPAGTRHTAEVIGRRSVVSLDATKY